MNKLALIAALGLGFLTACSTVTTQDECKQAVKTYNAYLDAIEAGKLLDMETINKAKLAALFLEANCGWFPVAKHRALGRVDRNGVLILTKEVR